MIRMVFMCVSHKPGSKAEIKRTGTIILESFSVAFNTHMLRQGNAHLNVYSRGRF